MNGDLTAWDLEKKLFLPSLNQTISRCNVPGIFFLPKKKEKKKYFSVVHMQRNQVQHVLNFSLQPA